MHVEKYHYSKRNEAEGRRKAQSCDLGAKRSGILGRQM